MGSTEWLVLYPASRLVLPYPQGAESYLDWLALPLDAPKVNMGSSLIDAGLVDGLMDDDCSGFSVVAFDCSVRSSRAAILAPRHREMKRHA